MKNKVKLIPLLVILATISACEMDRNYGMKMIDFWTTSNPTASGEDVTAMVRYEEIAEAQSNYKVFMWTWTDDTGVEQNLITETASATFNFSKPGNKRIEVSSRYNDVRYRNGSLGFDLIIVEP